MIPYDLLVEDAERVTFVGFENEHSLYKTHLPNIYCTTIVWDQLYDLAVEDVITIAKKYQLSFFIEGYIYDHSLREITLVDQFGKILYWESTYITIPEGTDDYFLTPTLEVIDVIDKLESEQVWQEYKASRMARKELKRRLGTKCLPYLNKSKPN